MSKPLTQPQKDSVRQALNFVKKLLDCLDQAHDTGTDTNREKEIRDVVADLLKMLDDGKIDAETADVSEKARTDGNGIHLNDQSTYSMPGDLLLEDCREGYFTSLWTIIETLIHEYAHYHRDTGLVGRVLRRVPDTFFGGAALMLKSLFGKTVRTWKWHEMKAYYFAYAMLSTLAHYLYMVCLKNPDCIPCCEQHQRNADEAKQRQDPHSTYGN